MKDPLPPEEYNDLTQERSQEQARQTKATLAAIGRVNEASKAASMDKRMVRIEEKLDQILVLLAKIT